MFPTKIVRFLGLAIITIVVLVAVVLDQKGIVAIMESIANIVFIAIGTLLTVAFGLIVFPERFLGKSEKKEEIEKQKFFPSEDERRKYRFAIRKEISNLVSELDKQGILLRHIVSKDWASERFEKRPLFFNPTEYEKIQDFYSKLDYWNQIVDNWSSQMKKEHEEFWSLLKKHCINSGNDVLKNIVW